jgi:hypothetical protein
MQWLAIAIFASVPILSRMQVEEHVDLLEVNHVYGRDNDYRFTQVIAWEREAATGKYLVRDWFVVQHSSHEPREVFKTSGGLYKVQWDQSRANRFVRSNAFIETHTYYDREVKNQKQMPGNFRLSLPRIK